MENKSNFGSFLVGMIVVIILLLPTITKFSDKQKEKTLQEFAICKIDSTFMPFSLEYDQYVAQFYQASKIGEGRIKNIEVLLLNKNTNETYKFNVVLDGYDYNYLYKNAVKFVERKIKNLPDKSITVVPIKTTNDTINNVNITE